MAADGRTLNTTLSIIRALVHPPLSSVVLHLVYILASLAIEWNHLVNAVETYTLILSSSRPIGLIENMSLFLTAVMECAYIATVLKGRR